MLGVSRGNIFASVLLRDRNSHPDGINEVHIPVAYALQAPVSIEVLYLGDAAEAGGITLEVGSLEHPQHMLLDIAPSDLAASSDVCLYS